MTDAEAGPVIRDSTGSFSQQHVPSSQVASFLPSRAALVELVDVLLASQQDSWTTLDEVLEIIDSRAFATTGQEGQSSSQTHDDKHHLMVLELVRSRLTALRENFERTTPTLHKVLTSFKRKEAAAEVHRSSSRSSSCSSSSGLFDAAPAIAVHDKLDMKGNSCAGCEQPQVRQHHHHQQQQPLWRTGSLGALSVHTTGSAADESLSSLPLQQQSPAGSWYGGAPIPVKSSAPSPNPAASLNYQRTQSDRQLPTRNATPPPPTPPASSSSSSVTLSSLARQYASPTGTRVVGISPSLVQTSPPPRPRIQDNGQVANSERGEIDARCHLTTGGFQQAVQSSPHKRIPDAREILDWARSHHVILSGSSNTGMSFQLKDKAAAASVSTLASTDCREGGW